MEHDKSDPWGLTQLVLSGQMPTHKVVLNMVFWKDDAIVVKYRNSCL